MSSINIEVTVTQASELIGRSERTIRRRCESEQYKARRDAGGQWIVPLRELQLSPDRELEYLQSIGVVPKLESNTVTPDEDIIKTLDGWQLETVMARKSIIDILQPLPRKAWKTTIGQLHLQYPNIRFSVPTVYKWIRDYEKDGLAGLIPGYGHRKGETSVPETAGRLFESLALQESEPSYQDVYTIVRGYMAKLEPKTKLPSSSAFVRWLKAKYPKPYIDLRRKGYRFYQRHHEYFIERDAGDIAAGKAWYSDHHQLDTIVSTKDGKTARPWATVWRDVRTGKMLSCYLHVEAPNSDHIFYSFYLGVKDFGLPDFIYIDNGKDYRVHDFTGSSRRNIDESELLERKARSLMGLLNVDVVFATPYNAQAKTVERDFRKLINQFSKFLAGYTGSNPTKRPEATTKEVAGGELLQFEECQDLLRTYIRDTFNKKRSNGRLLKGLSPDEAFQKYRKDVRKVSSESLRLCMMRTSRAKRIDRNGVIDRELGIELRYWAEWMMPLKGTQVYLRRDIQNYGEAWIWQDDNDAFLGKATLAESIPLRAETEIDKERLKKEIARKRASLRTAREATRQKVKLDGREIIESMARGVALDQPPTPPDDLMGMPAVTYQTTDMDRAAQEEQRAQKTGTYDTSLIVPEEQPKRKRLSLFECDVDE